MIAAHNVGDQSLWFAVILGGISACWYIPSLLHYVKELAVVSAPTPTPAEPQLQHDAEAAIKTSTLLELTRGPNNNLTAAAIKLTASRFFKTKGARNKLLSDLSSNEWERRDQAITGIRLLFSHPALKDLHLSSHFLDYDSYIAVVLALVNLLPEHEHHATDVASYTSPIRPAIRPAHERSILDILLTLLNDPNRQDSLAQRRQHIQHALCAGLITKWLSNYPFPCTLPVNRRFNFRRNDVCRLLNATSWGGDDPKMAILMQILLTMDVAKRQLVDVGLLTSNAERVAVDPRERATRSHPTATWSGGGDTPWMTPFDDDDDSDDNYDRQASHDILMANDGELLGQPESAQVRNRPEVTPGGRSRLRRHRQAVLVAAPGVPLGPQSILLRRPTETELSELASLQEIQSPPRQILRSPT